VASACADPGAVVGAEPGLASRRDPLWYGSYVNTVTNEVWSTGIGAFDGPHLDGCTATYLGNFDGEVEGEKLFAGPVAISAAHCVAARFKTCKLRFRPGDIRIWFYDANQNDYDVVRVDALRFRDELSPDEFGKGVLQNCTPKDCGLFGGSGGLEARIDSSKDLVLLHLEKPPKQWVEPVKILLYDTGAPGFGAYDIGMTAWRATERKVAVVGYSHGSNPALYLSPWAPGTPVPAGTPTFGYRYGGFKWLQSSPGWGDPFDETVDVGCHSGSYTQLTRHVGPMLRSVSVSNQGETGVVLDAGDSGGPMLVLLGGNTEISVPCNGPKCPAPGMAPSPLLIGVLSGGSPPSPSNYGTVYPDPTLAGMHDAHASTWLELNGGWIRSALASSDWDNDLRPYSIDNCPGTPNPVQRNTNKDVEEDLHITDPDNHPLPRGDTCDPFGSTQIGLNASPTDLLPASYGLADCEKTTNLLPGAKCRFRLKTRITLDFLFQPPHDALAGLWPGQTGLRFCWCDGIDTKSSAGRTQCAQPLPGGFDCQMQGERFEVDPNNRWQKQTTVYQGVAKQDWRYNDSFRIDPAYVPTLAIWRVLTDMTTLYPALKPPPWDDGDVGVVGLHGVLWAHVTEFKIWDDASKAFVLQSTANRAESTFGRAFTSGDTTLMRSTNAILEPLASKIAKAGKLTLVNQSYVPSGVYQIWPVPTDSTPGSEIVFGFGLDGPQALGEVLEPAAKTLLTRAAEGTTLFVSASEPAGFHRLSPFTLLGASVDPVSGEVVDSLGFASGKYLSLGPTGWSIRDNPPIAAKASVAALAGEADAIALAGTRQELYQLRSKPSWQSAKLFRYVFPSQTWTEIALAGPALPRKPMALAFRADDGKLYAIDRHGVRLRLWRVGLDGATEQIAWSWWLPARDDVRLEADPRGHLLLITSARRGLTFTRAVRLAFDDDGKIRVDGQVIYPGRLAAEPALTERGIELATTLPGDHVAFHVAGDEDLIHCPALETIHDL
jgi:hypothetical protein